MAGRKRKLPPDFVPEPWQEPLSDEEGEWRPIPNLLLLSPLRGNLQIRDQDDNVSQGEEHEHDEGDVNVEPLLPVEAEGNDGNWPEVEAENDSEPDASIYGPNEHGNETDDASIYGANEHGNETAEDNDDYVQMLRTDDDDEEHDAQEEEERQVEGQQQDEEEDGEEAEEERGESFKTVHEHLVRDWLLTEIEHHVSKAASSSFWKVADKYFHSLYGAKEREGISRKVPQFMQERKKIHDKNVPKISMEVAYQHKHTGEISVVENVQSIPASRYPPNLYTKIYEVASVEVNIMNYLSFNNLFPTRKHTDYL